MSDLLWIAVPGGRLDAPEPDTNDDAVLRFNACVRMIEHHGLTEPVAEEREPLLE